MHQFKKQKNNKYEDICNFTYENNNITFISKINNTKSENVIQYDLIANIFIKSIDDNKSFNKTYILYSKDDLLNVTLVYNFIVNNKKDIILLFLDDYYNNLNKLNYWINNNLIYFEKLYYDSINKYNIFNYSNDDFNEFKIEIILNENNNLKNKYFIEVITSVKSKNNIKYNNIIQIFKSNNYIDTHKALEYIINNRNYLYDTFKTSILKQDFYYLDLYNWILNNKFLNKLKNQFESDLRDMYLLYSMNSCSNLKKYIENLDNDYKIKYIQNVIKPLIDKRIKDLSLNFEQILI